MKRSAAYSTGHRPPGKKTGSIYQQFQWVNDNGHGTLEPGEIQAHDVFEVSRRRKYQVVENKLILQND